MQKTKKDNTLKKEVSKTKAVKASKPIEEKITENVTTKVVEELPTKVEAKAQANKEEKGSSTTKKKSTTKAKSNTTNTKSTSKAKIATKKVESKKVEQVKLDVEDKTEIKVQVEPKIESEKINLYEVIGQCEVKLIPYNGEKDEKKYPVNVVLKDLGFVKAVVVRYTVDNWDTYTEQPLEFVSKEDELEEWGTVLKINKKNKDKFQYVIKYVVNEWTFWDNNWENNYTY